VPDPGRLALLATGLLPMALLAGAQPSPVRETVRRLAGFGAASTRESTRRFLLHDGVNSVLQIARGGG
jgi:hypothetical protein